jgi:hypothetical protein
VGGGGAAVAVEENRRAEEERSRLDRLLRENGEGPAADVRLRIEARWNATGVARRFMRFIFREEGEVKAITKDKYKVRRIRMGCRGCIEKGKGSEIVKFSEIA